MSQFVQGCLWYGPQKTSVRHICQSYQVETQMKLDYVSLQGVNIMAFCKEYNAATQDKVGTVIPVEITVFEVCT